jgi:hypothetical protein
MSMTPLYYGVRSFTITKLFIVRIVKSFNGSITPGLTDRDKDRLYAKIKAEPNDQTGRPWVAVTSSKAEFIVKLKEVWQPDRFPASQKAGGDLTIFFGSLRFNVNLMAQKIHHIERIKSTISFYISRAYKIGLVNIVKVKRLSKIRVLNTLWDIRSFF